MYSHTLFLGLLGLLSPLPALAVNAPGYAGYTQRWSSVFPYAQGVLPDYQNDKWNVITGYLGQNNESEVYTRSPANLQCSGQGTLQITPVRDARGAWTSGRIESRYIFTPTAGKATIGEARIRFGANPTSRKQGLWPAFWVLGDSYRHGTKWPGCGELDIMETVNGRLTGYGTAHCGSSSGGPCKEPTGTGLSTTIADQGWHTWRIRWDRTQTGANSWRSESITWYMDGRQFLRIQGSTINDVNAWNALCHSPMYFILNMAVGGYWPGPPNSQTLGGAGSMMEVAYVAHYVSN